MYLVMVTMRECFKGEQGKLLVCNMPPFELTAKEVHATCMVDFKMMNALTKGQIQLDMYDWILGTRPRKWMEMRPDFYMKYAQKIKNILSTRTQVRNHSKTVLTWHQLILTVVISQYICV